MGNIVRCRQYLSVNPLPRGTEKLKKKKTLKIKTVPSSFLAEMFSETKEQREEGMGFEWVISTHP